MMLDEAYAAISDRSRRRMLQLLETGELAAGEIADEFDMAWPSVSRHLGILRTAGLIEGRKAGSNIVYSLVPRTVNELIADLSRVSHRPPSHRYRVVLATAGLRGNPVNPEENGPYALLLETLPSETFEILKVASQRFRTAKETAEAVLLENPDAVGIIVHFDAHSLVPEVMSYLHEGGAHDLPVFVAGSFPLDAISTMKRAGVEACLLERIGTEHFVEWLGKAITTREALKALDLETRETYRLGESFSAAIHSNSNQELSDQDRSIEEIVVRQLAPKVKVTLIKVDCVGSDLTLEIQTPDSGILVGRGGWRIEAITKTVREMTGADKVSVNVIETREPLS